MHEKVKLNPGEPLKRESSRIKGTLGQTDIDTYSVINDQLEEVVGSVVHTDITAINGFKRTQTLVQKDASGNIIVDTQW